MNNNNNLVYIPDIPGRKAIKYTYKDWWDSKKSWTDYAIPGHEVDSDIYFYFLGTVPPILKARGFLTGEPYGVDSKGRTTYIAFIRGTKFDKGKYFYVGVTDVESFNNRYEVRGE